MHPLTSRFLLLFLSLAAPALAAGPEVDGIVIGQTRCEDAIRTVYAQARARVQAATTVPAEGSMEVNGLRAMLKKPKGDQTPYKVLYAEDSQLNEKKDLESAAQGPDKPALNREECGPYGPLAPQYWVSMALSLDDPETIDFAALGLKSCPYDSRLFRVAGRADPDTGLFCMDGVVGLYQKMVPVEMPKVQQELTAKYGSGKDLGMIAQLFEWATKTVTQFQSSVLFTHADGQIVLVGLGTGAEGPVPYTSIKGDDYKFTMPKKLAYKPSSEISYFSKAATEAIESDRKLYEKLVAQMATLKKQKKHR